MEDMNRERRSEFRRYRYDRPSFFFPIALITAGVVWLLVNNGTISAENVYRLAPLWPVLLIIAGLGLIFRRIWWPLSAVTWLAAAGLVIWLLLNPGLLPKTAVPAFQHDVYHEPLGGAKSADVTVKLSVNHAEVSALSDSTDLIEADLYHLGNIDFHTTGTNQKTVQLSDNWTSTAGFMRWDLLFTGDTQPWKIGLTPQIPLNLKLEGGTGSANLDLSELKITSLNLDGGTGSKKVLLPANSPHFPFTLNGGTGSITINVPANASFDLNTNGGTGSLHVNLPPGAGVQVDVRNGGLGGLNLGSDFKKVSGSQNDKEGVWENAAYFGAKSPIKIRLDIGTGSVTIR